MNLTDYFRILIRRGWIILLAIALTAGAAYALSKVQTPVYRATQKILIKPARNDNGLTQTLKQLLASWATRLDTDARAQEAIDAAALDMQAGALHSLVHISQDLNTLQLIVDVDNTDGATAEKIALIYGLNFIEWRNQENQPLRLEDRITAELLDTPHYGLYRPQTTVNVAAGALLGLLLGGLAVFILEYIESNVVRRAADIERQLQLPVLGNLPNIQ
jgi:capsular polysaccharide biosynthesis protein